MTSEEPNFLYLTTKGRRSGQPREIEIWFTQNRNRYYVISYLYGEAHWVRNIRKNRQVTFRVGKKSFSGEARILEPSGEPDLCRRVQHLSDVKYGWKDGLIVELVPQKQARQARVPGRKRAKG